VTSCKAIVVGRFEKPAKAAIAGGPKHEITGYLPGHCIGCCPILSEMHSFRANAEHELCFARYGPGLLEHQVRIPLCRTMRKEGRHTRLKLQSILDRCGFDRKVWRKARRTSGHIPACSRADLKNGNGSSGRNNPLVHERVSLVVENAVGAVKFHPDGRNVSITVGEFPPAKAVMDVRNLESAIYNLLLNACSGGSSRALCT
jgi:hypothetical protein